MGYRLNRLDEPVFMTGPKPRRAEFRAFIIDWRGVKGEKEFIFHRIKGIVFVGAP